MLKIGDFVKILLAFSTLSDLFLPIHVKFEVVASGGYSVIDLSECICNFLSLFVWVFVVVPNIVPMLNLPINNKNIYGEIWDFYS